jgi:hypothetical protein
MSTDLERSISEIKICDTHEHLWHEDKWREQPPDVIHELFDNYVKADFVCAGADDASLKRLFDTSNADIPSRFEPVKEVWANIQFTGYGEASKIIAKKFFDIDEIDSAGLARAQEALPESWPGGDRLNVLRDTAGLHHVQVDDFVMPCERDDSGPDFFLYDISWVRLCCGNFKPHLLHTVSGVEVTGLDSLREAMARIFEKYAADAVAVKAQHAYSRTLLWEERADDDAARILERHINKEELTVEERNCLGDWCWSRGVELAIEHDLPFKIHTGYYAGNDRMPVDFIKPGNLCALLAKYPQARFVLMHISYPYWEELIALTKHYGNVWADLCWAWSINPYASGEFLKSAIHCAPVNKVFAFGGDTMRPRAAAAYAMQARNGIARALQEEVASGRLKESEAIGVADAVLQGNQFACFPRVVR